MSKEFLYKVNLLSSFAKKEKKDKGRSAAVVILILIPIRKMNLNCDVSIPVMLNTRFLKEIALQMNLTR